MPYLVPRTRTINITAYIVAFVLAVVTTFGLKFCQREAHDRAHTSPQNPPVQSTEIIIADLNNTLSEANEDWLRTMIGVQMQFHGQHTLLEEPLTVKVSLWESDADFKNYQSRISRSSSSSKGFYSVSRKELVVNKSQKDYLKTLAHEAQHLLIRQGGFRPPRWLNEGLSEYFEEVVADEKGWQVEEQTWRSQRLRQWLEADQLPSLADFLGDSSTEWKARDEKTPYLSQSLSWGLVYFLMQTPQGRSALLKTIQDLKQGLHAGDSARILNNHYSLSQLEQAFYHFIAEIPAQQTYLQE